MSEDKKSKDSLGDRMKGQQMAEGGRCFLPGVPVCIRLDGRGFSRYTKGLHRPYDQRLSEIMVELTKTLVSETNALIGYTQSDEISLVLYEPNTSETTYFGGRIQKTVSMTAAVATAHFNRLAALSLPEKAGKIAYFDSRAWSVPTLMEAANCLLWRELDATKNSISMAAQGFFSHKILHGKTGAEKQEMMFQNGVNWNDYPAFFKRGTYVTRVEKSTPFTKEELDGLPERHQARTNPDLVVVRHCIEARDFPLMSSVKNRVGVFFHGETPEVLDKGPLADRMDLPKHERVEHEAS